MDRDLDALENAPAFSYRRLWLTLLISSAIIVVGSFLVRSFPNAGHEAGDEAVVEKGPEWVRAEVDAANGTALAACDELHDEYDAAPDSPRYEYESFVKGCGDAFDRILGRHIPLLPAGGR